MLCLRSLKFSLFALFALSTAPFASAQAQVFTDVSVGIQHICGLTDAGEVDCFTEVGASRFDAPDDLPLLSDITGGFQHSCGITLDGGAVCWGSPAFGALDVPEFDAPLVSISAGDNHTCAVDEQNRAVCWGLDTNEQTQVPGDGFGENGIGFVEVAAGQNTSCGIETDGSISCWSTDPSLLDTSSLNGTFVDLAVGGRFLGCGLTDTGDIQCWQSTFDPPSNGPYTDLVADGTFICGLNDAQSPDCTFNPNFGIGINNPELFDTSTQFVSLEARSAFTFQRIENVCGLTINSTIECLDVSNLGGVPGVNTSPGSAEVDIELSLTATITGQNQVELFWTPLSGLLPRTFVEVFRNGVSIAVVDNQFSFFDLNFSNAGTDTVDYQVRPLDGDGNVGEFSNLITVNALEGTVSGDSSINLADTPAPNRLIDSIDFQFVNVSLSIISWDAPRVGENGVAAYEIRANNETIGITDNNLFLLRGFSSTQCVLLSVAAISEDGQILDFRSTIRIINQGALFACAAG